MVYGKYLALKAGKSGLYANRYWCIIYVSDSLSASSNSSGAGSPPVGAIA